MADLPPGAARTQRKVRQASAALAREALGRMEAELPFFVELPADQRAGIGLVVQAGLSAFSAWLEQADAGPEVGAGVFAVAPRELVRAVSLQHTVDMVRLAVDTVEERVATLAEPETVHWLREAVLRYSRELAFAAAQVYAAAAEVRGAWDARLEALVIDGLVRGSTGETGSPLGDSVLGRAAALGWRSTERVVAMAGRAPAGDPEPSLVALHRVARDVGADLLAGVHGRALVSLVGAVGDPRPLLGELLACYGEGPVVVGPVVLGLAQATASAQAALGGLRVAAAWPSAPRPVSARALLGERALAGEQAAAEELIETVYEPLVEAGGELLTTVGAYIEGAGSIDGAARLLFVHANTVRYRLRRVAELTGLSATDPRDGFLLHVALVQGRLRSAAAV
ncbi:MAG TPA: helix-turn-helix domain-containing protein [Frankiaceae bacterium]|nr:helix-turn-helix domain-containing protein [Frankiaceae bacterium]